MRTAIAEMGVGKYLYSGSMERTILMQARLAQTARFHSQRLDGRRRPRDTIEKVQFSDFQRPPGRHVAACPQGGSDDHNPEWLCYNKVDVNAPTP